MVLQSDFGHATRVPVNGSPSAGTRVSIAPTAAEQRKESKIAHRRGTVCGAFRHLRGDECTVCRRCGPVRRWAPVHGTFQAQACARRASDRAAQKPSIGDYFADLRQICCGTTFVDDSKKIHSC